VNTNDNEIKAALLFSCPFIHPSIIMRREVLAKSGLRYDPHIIYAQDYVLYSNLWKYGSFGNLPQALIKYRIHNQEVRITSDTNNAEILKSRMLAWRNILRELRLEASDDLLHVHDKCIYYIDRITAHEIALIPKYLKFLDVLNAQNNRLQVFDISLFKANLKQMAYKVLRMPRLSTAMFLRLWLQHTRLLGIYFWLKLPFKQAKERLIILAGRIRQ
jgi:hypothetical protein